MRITGATVVAGVVGQPVAQSLSPVIHNAWIAARGLDAVYVAFAVREGGFVRWIGGLREGGVRGLNVTMPFKGEALRAADRATPRAQAVSGANSLTFEAEGLVADSTDGRGMLSALAEQAPAWRAETGPVAVYGAGGAALAGVAALVEAGVPQVRVLARDPAKAAGMVGPLGERVVVRPWGDRVALEDVSALINGASAGFLGQGGVDVAWEATPPDAVVMDMVGTPLETALLREARARGHVCVDGLAMLIGQARPSFEAFFGVPAPSAVELDVRALCLKAIAEKAGAR